MSLLEKDKNTGKLYMNPIFEVTIEDIFNKFDMLMNRVLGYREFKGFCDAIGRNLTYADFRDSYVRKYQSTGADGIGHEEGLTLNGFKDFF